MEDKEKVKGSSVTVTHLNQILMNLMTMLSPDMNPIENSWGGVINGNEEEEEEDDVFITRCPSGLILEKTTTGTQS